MNKKFRDWIETEDWRSDLNKAKIIQKKHKATSAVALAKTKPSEENILIAYGLLIDYIGSMTAMKENPQKELSNLREELDEIGDLLNGDPNDTTTQKLYKKYKVKRVIEKKGIYKYNRLINSYNIAKKLYEICIKANDLAQKLGFGSAIPFEEVSWKEKLI